MRDLERWKDQVELSLDGRQIFFLFFGSAVAACVIFVAGVLVGKRIEQRACTPPAVADPLAVLDQMGTGEDEGLTFHEALGRREVRGRRVEPGRHVRQEGRPETATVSTPVTARAPASGAEAPAARPAVATVEGKEAKEGKKPESAGAGTHKPEAAMAVAVIHKPNDERYTLHISAFSEKGDAEDFLHRIQAAGYRPSLVQSEIPGRGMFYRVRVGDFTSKKAALEAKSEFERRQRLPVYVARL
jgi:DedD protein